VIRHLPKFYLGFFIAQINKRIKLFKLI